ncbi:tyrosine-type recombinase/integrase [Limimaricola hongkongensis]|uniref:tyrosine-type recombinase/integrase n=1 Tax=Limimaricola hongkongensis TaxID=278132 RepID=UPI0003692DE3|nr:tyrosine-type recombinase/integrase [Limimaricola hongkongensis]
MTKKDLPKFCYRKGAKGYVYFQRRGGKTQRIHSEPGTADFAAEYAMLLRGRQPTPAKTMKGLIASYMESSRWTDLKPVTQKGYRRHLRYFEDVIAAVDPRTMKRVHVIEMRNALADTPTDANRKVGVLSVLFEHAIDIGWINQGANPAKDVAKLKSTKPKREAWPSEMIAAFRREAGPRPLRAFELLLGTGQRVEDVRTMRWDQIEDDGIRVRQSKTSNGIWVPFTDSLRAAIASMPRHGETILAQENGKAFAYQTLWADIMAVRKKIGAERWDIHALRHAAASEIAALPGMTDEHIMAITGHSSKEMAQLYAGAARQKARAMEAQKGRK